MIESTARSTFSWLKRLKSAVLCPLTSTKKVTNYSERSLQLVIYLRLSYLQSTKYFFVWQILVKLI